MEDDESASVAAQLAADASNAKPDSPPGFSFDFCRSPVNPDSSSDDIATRATEAEDSSLDVSGNTQGLQVLIPAIPTEFREQYKEIHSTVVEKVLVLTDPVGSDDILTVEFTDGTQRNITLREVKLLENGMQALDTCFMNVKRATRNRKHGYYDEALSNESSDESVEADSMDLDSDNDSEVMLSTTRTRTLRPRIYHSTAESSKLEEDSEDLDLASTSQRRSSRKRQTRFPDSILQEALQPKRPQRQQLLEAGNGDEDEDDFFLPITSDLVHGGKKRKRKLQRVRPQRAHQARSTRRASSASDIEFEPPRRSTRATRNISYTQEELDVDEDSYYRVEETTPGAPKLVSVKEHFRPLPPDSSFASVHMSMCYTCQSSNNGQLIFCQGCSYSYHKQCIGSRSAREHLVTKIGEASFVLQCRFCIEFQQRKDGLAPRRAMCQACKSSGVSCAPFSKRQTIRQEEKLREQNDGVDPVTDVAQDLINATGNVLFRCRRCHRAWHQSHLPRIGSPSALADQPNGALKDYSIDWHCNECTSAQQKIQRVVAWRTKDSAVSGVPAFSDFVDDDKEYLVKWDTLSYFHCTWMPGAWIAGVAVGSARTAFAKRANEADLFKLTTKDAIPEELLTIDIVFRVKLAPTALPGVTEEDDLANVSHVSQALVKFQGLGYDDVVWDKPPSEDSRELYTAFENAYRDYLAGKNFKHSPWPKMKERINSFQNREFEKIGTQPVGLRRGKLMAYQLEGLNWLVSNYHDGRSIVLADEMGLGKTVQVVSLITYLVQERPQCWPFLVSVPNATCPNWRREFKQWAPELRVVTYHGGRESQQLAYKHELFPRGDRDMTAHVVIMSYDSTQDPKTSELFSSVRWAGLVVDEGQRLKNDRNLLYQALRAMKIPFRLLLTGTPLQNNKRELFNLIQFIDNSQNAEKLDEEFQVLDKETLPKLHDKIRPYFLRRTKAGVLKFLPPMAQIILPVTMTVIQEKLSKSIMAKNPQLIKAIFANGKMTLKERGSLNNILMQLRKCLCHPFMYSDAIEEKNVDAVVEHRNLVEASAKLLLLEVMLPKLKERGHRVLIFSQFLQQLDILEDFLNGIGYQFKRLDGNLSSMEKQRRIDAFNAPDSPIFAFLLSTRAGGVGINLATADTVIIMDPDFNPHQDIQALSRAHRIGQKKKVLCFQLMMKDTIEEKIMQIGKKKMALDHALIEKMDDEELAGDDLESILKHGAQALFSDDYQKGAIHYNDSSVDKLLDRSQMEQTKVDEEGSAEAQFSYAKVWANEKAALEDGLGAPAESEAPTLISSSVWDKILAEREAEARRQAEANQERLGRGGRRRTTTNYAKDSLQGYLQDGEAANELPSSSDEFASGDGSSSSDEDVVLMKAEEAAEPLPSSRRTAIPGKGNPGEGDDELQGQIGPPEAGSQRSSGKVGQPGAEAKGRIKAKYSGPTTHQSNQAADAPQSSRGSSWRLPELRVPRSLQPAADVAPPWQLG